MSGGQMGCSTFSVAERRCRRASPASQARITRCTPDPGLKVDAQFSAADYKGLLKAHPRSHPVSPSKKKRKCCTATRAKCKLYDPYPDRQGAVVRKGGHVTILVVERHYLCAQAGR